MSAVLHSVFISQAIACKYSCKMNCFKVIRTDNEVDEILYKNFLPSVRNGYIEVGKGKYCLPVNYLLMVENIKNLEMNDNDVIVASHPKTGTTWTQEMVWMIANELDFEGGKEILSERFPFLEVTSLFDYAELMREYEDFVPPKHILNSIDFVKSKKSPRFIKTHLPYELLPNQILNNDKMPKMIYVARNAKDTCVSYYHHCKLIEGYTGNFEDFCKLFLGGRVCFGPFWKHVLGYWERRHQENILFITYEEMKKDLSSVIKRVAKFLEKDLNDEKLNKLIDHLSFESMKKNDSVNYEFILNFSRKFNLVNQDGTFMRSGKVGGYKAVMTPELIEKFDAWTKENIEGTGLSFDG